MAGLALNEGNFLSPTHQTWLVHQAMSGTSATSRRRWTLTYPASIFADGFDDGGTSNWSRKVP